VTIAAVGGREIRRYGVDRTAWAVESGRAERVDLRRQ